MNHFFNSHKKGNKLMVCEVLLRYFGTSSEEIAEKAREKERQFYLPQIEELIAKVNQLTCENNQLTSKNNQLTSELEEIKKHSPQNNSTY